MAIQNAGMASRSRSGAFATAAMVLFAYSAMALLTLHFLRPDYAPATNFISNYAVGRYGWIMTTWFLGMSCGLLTLAAGLYTNGLRSIVASLGIFLLIIAAIGLVVSAIFPTDAPGAPSTSSGAIHDMSFLVNVGSILIATVLLSVSFGAHPVWRSYRRTAWILTSLIFIGFVVQFLTLHKGMPYGLANRFFVVVLFAWLFAVSFRLRAPPREQAAKKLPADQ